MSTYLFLLRLATAMVVRRQVTWQKAANLAGALWHYYRRTPRPGTYPVALVVDPIEACNLGCFICPVGRQDKRQLAPRLALEDYRHLVDEVKNHVAIMVFYVNGEPFLHPRFLEMVEYASCNRIYTLTSTNGHAAGHNSAAAERLVRSGLDRLIITISGATQETYVKYHQNGHLNKVLSNTSRIVEAKKHLGTRTPHVTLRYLKFAYNLDEMPAIRAIAKTIGVDEIDFREARVTFTDDAGAVYTDRLKTEYRDRFIPADRLDARKERIKPCGWPWLIGVVTAGGAVPVCTQYSYIVRDDAENSMGRLSGPTPFRTVWLGSRYQHIRDAIGRDQHAMSVCRGCSRGVGFGDDV